MTRRGFRWIALLAAAALLSVAAPATAHPAGDVTTLVIVIGSDTDDVATAVREHGGSSILKIDLIEGVTASMPSFELDELAADSRVSSIALDEALEMQGESYAGGAASTYPTSVGANELGWDGSGIGVALLDTGISPHQDLVGRVVASADLSDEGSFVDTFGHGTFLAGLIAGDGASSDGRYIGVAPGAHLMSVKVAGADGETTLGRVLYGLQLIDHSKERFNIRVVVMALAGPAHDGPDPLELAVDRMWADGLTVVLPSGNDGPGTDSLASPGVDPYAITVGGTDERTTSDVSDDVIGDWSAAGITLGGISKPEVVAPGARLISLRSPGSTIDNNHPAARIEGAYFRGSGTSMSAAVTAGAIAVMLQADPSLTPDQIKGRLIATARSIAKGEDPIRSGAGTIDVAAAINSNAPAANQKIPALIAEPVPSPKGAASFDWQKDPSGIAFWAGRAWAGRAWAGRAWAGRAWADADWTGRAWADSEWAGRAWAGRAWAGRAWAGRAWAGRVWAGRAWAGRAWANYGWAAEAWDR